MSTKADFTEEEWHGIETGPTSAGMLVALASRGGSFKESFSMAKAYAEARQNHGESELLDELVSSRPKSDRGGSHTAQELQAHVTEVLAAAVAAIQAKGTPEEVDDYRNFVHGLAERVAHAHAEDGQEVSPSEQQTIDTIDQALGMSASAE